MWDEMKKNIKTYEFLLMFFIAAAGCTTINISSDNIAGAQTVMNIYIQNKLTSGGDKYDIDGFQAEFDQLHSNIEVKNDLYVSCADFKTEKGLMDIDYYVRKNGNFYEMVKEVFHKRNGEIINKILWEKIN